MEAKILEQMRRNFQKQSPKQIPPKMIEPNKTIAPLRKSPERDMSREVSRDGSEDARLSRYLNSPIKYEIEVSFGTFKNDGDRRGGAYTPGVSIFQFNNLLAKLTNFANEKSWSVDKKHTLEEIGGGIKKITTIDPYGENSIAWQEKIRHRDDIIDNHTWGYRINKSEEKYTDTSPERFNPELTREKHRTTFLINEDSLGFMNVKIDLTKVIEKARSGVISTKYEVEIERVERQISLLHFKNAIKFVLGVMQRNLDHPENVMTISEIRKSTNMHNSLFGVVGSETLFSNYWNKPKNLKIFDLINPKNKFCVTLKINGIRILILLVETGTYACIPPFNIWKIGPSPKKEICGSLLDAEMHTTDDGDKIYYAFDCLFSRGRDFRGKRFIERLEETKFIVGQHENIKVKEFYCNDDFYKNVNSAFKEVRENPDDLEFDGLILQPSGHYKNDDTRKWKPKDLLTIDFKLSKYIRAAGKDTATAKDEFSLLVGIGKNKALGIDKDYKSFGSPTPFTISIPNGILKIDNSINTEVTIHADGIIVECKWDGDRFVPVKYRDDKDEPNFITTVEDVWEDIKNPVTKETIAGKTLLTMRKFHNAVKKYMLETTFKKGDVINDWGTGRGGDIDKWRKIGISKVYAVEPNEENVEELNRRVKEAGWGDHIKILSKYESPNGRVYIGAEETHHMQKAIQGDVNGIVSFFSLTFFGKDKNTFEGMINTIDEILPMSKKFIGIVMDGERVVKLLDGNSKYEDAAFSIEKVSEFVGSVETGKNEIRVEIKEATSMVKYNEWLFYFEDLVKALKKIGVELKMTGFLDEKDSPKEIEGVKRFKMLPKPGKTFSALNRYFVFERVSEKHKTIPPALDIGKLFGIEKSEKYLIDTLTTNKKTSFIESVMCAIDKSCVVLEDGERERRVKVLRKSMSESLTSKFYKKLGRNEPLDEFKKMLSDTNIDIPATIYADILSALLKINILIIYDKTKYIKLDSERELFACYKNTAIIYGRKGLFSLVTVKDGNKIYRCHKTNGTFVKKILEAAVTNKKIYKMT